jgi:DNA-binding CsgD family transcriptional regulator
MPSATQPEIRDLLDMDFAWTPRQREVLDRITAGKSNQQIADELGISLDGAKWHMREILSKLNLETREDAAEYWRLYNGWKPRLARTFRRLANAAALKWAGAVGVVAVAVAGGALVYAALSGDDEPDAGQPAEATPTVTATATTASTAAPTPAPTPVGHPTGTRTGIPEVDRVIEAVLAADSVRIAELMVWHDVVCTAGPPTQIGAPPQCPAGIPGGSTIEAFGAGSCEGSQVPRGQEQQLLATMSGSGKLLYAVFESDPPGSYGVVFAAPSPTQQGGNVGHTYWVSDAGIIYFNSGCAATPASRIEFMGVTDFVLAPPS